MAENDEDILKNIVEKVEANNLVGLRSIVEKLSPEKCEELVSKSFWNETPLETACRLNLVDVAEFLITSCHADVNQENKRGNIIITPLFVAVEHATTELVRTLVENGCDLHWKNYDGQNALVYACLKNSIPVANFLTERHVQINCKANMNLCLESTHYYNRSLNLGTDVNWSDNNGNTLFIEASRRDNFELMELLCIQNIDRYHRNKKGENALDVAIMDANALLVTNLLGAGIYTKADKVSSYEFCGAQTVVSASSFERAKILWHKSLGMRQKYPEDFDVKTAFTSAEMPFPIKEFVSHEEVESFKNEDLVLQALLVYLRILTSKNPATHAAFYDVVLSDSLIIHLNISFKLMKQLFLFHDLEEFKKCPVVMAMVCLTKLCYRHVDADKPIYWVLVTIFLNLVDFLTSDVWQLLSSNDDNSKYFILYEEQLNLVLMYLSKIMQFGELETCIDIRVQRLAPKFTPKCATSLLHIALSRNFPFKIVAYLVKCNAKLDIQDKQGNLPIHLAISRFPNISDERYKIAVYLICAGSSMDVPSIFGINPRDTFLKMY